MCKLDFDKLDLKQLFPPPPKKHPDFIRKKRTWDVKVTIKSAGKNGYQIRFGFINWAASVLKGCQYIEPSNVEYLKDRIYFRIRDQKTHRNIHSLSSNGKNGTSFYFSIKPSEKAERIYRTNWVNHTYMFKHDDENNLFYIENIEED